MVYLYEKFPYEAVLHQNQIFHYKLCNTKDFIMYIQGRKKESVYHYFLMYVSRYIYAIKLDTYVT